MELHAPRASAPRSTPARRRAATRSRPLLVRLSQLAMQTADADAARARGLHPVHLLGGRGHERRHQQHVGRLLRAGTPRSARGRGWRARRPPGRAMTRRTVPALPAGGWHPASDTPAAAPCASCAARSARARGEVAGAGTGRSPSARARGGRPGPRTRCACGHDAQHGHAVGIGLQPLDARPASSRAGCSRRCATSWPRAASSSTAVS